MEIDRHFTTDLDAFLTLGIIPVGYTLEQFLKMISPYISASEVIKRALMVKQS